MIGNRSAEQTFSDRELRDALGLFPTGVTVVTTVTATGEWVGATVSSFNSVSLQPPLILFSMARGSSAFAVWLAARHFVVNVLAQDQGKLSTAFARALTDKWGGVPYRVGSHGMPVLADSLTCLECDRYAQYDGGDHLIIVGRVVTLHAGKRSDMEPLVFFRSKYERLAIGRSIEAPIDAVGFQCGW
ncbi:MAG: flavin reductase [Rhizobiales bacterium]|nr:flavin reductase [Hyphomicrobiales bacterium]